MIRHQRITVDVEARRGGRRLEQLQKPLAIGGIREHVRPIVSTLEDMNAYAGDEDASGSGHGSPRQANEQDSRSASSGDFPNVSMNSRQFLPTKTTDTRQSLPHQPPSA